jgi:Complex I intermediate-associated protein 30 (CIA30)
MYNFRSSAAVFSGMTSPANNGGFASVRTRESTNKPFDWSNYDAIQLRVRLDILVAYCKTNHTMSIRCVVHHVCLAIALFAKLPFIYMYVYNICEVVLFAQYVITCSSLVCLFVTYYTARCTRTIKTG